MNDNLPKTQLIHPVTVSVLPSSGLKLSLEADDNQRSELANLSTVLSVERFRCDMVFKRWRKDGITVKGKLEADIFQQCVISLEPLNSTINENFERTFLPEGSKLVRPNLNGEGEMLLDPEGKDEPDLFIGDKIDAWDIAIEHFQLEIDLYAKLPDAEFNDYATTSVKQTSTEPKSPFAVLNKLITSKKS